MIYRIFIINLLDVVFILYIYCVNLVTSYMEINGNSGLSMRINAGLGLPVFKGKINVGVFYDRMRLKKGVLDRDIMGATITLTLYEIFFRRKVE